MKRTHKIVLPGYGLEDHIAEALEYLREHEPPEGYYVGFSGGKDSIVTRHLCLLAGVKFQAVYSCTRIDPPEMYAFIKQHYPNTQWVFPRVSVYEAIQKKNPPPTPPTLVLRRPQKRTSQKTSAQTSHYGNTRRRKSQQSFTTTHRLP